jgi:mRNA interferase YafQ
MRTLVASARFQRDLKRIERSGWKTGRLLDVLEYLEEGKPLPARYEDHPLKGEWAGYRDCHIQGNKWVLIYKISGDEVLLVATGSHSDCGID